MKADRLVNIQNKNSCIPLLQKKNEKQFKGLVTLAYKTRTFMKVQLNYLQYSNQKLLVLKSSKYMKSTCRSSASDQCFLSQKCKKLFAKIF